MFLTPVCNLPHLVQDGKVVCQQVSCPPVSCINPSFIDGQCCPVCLSEFGLHAAMIHGGKNMRAVITKFD